MRFLSWFGILLLSLGVLFWPGRANISEKEKDSAPRSEGLYRSDRTTANLGIFVARMYETEKGKKKWKILSKFAELHRKDDYAFMKEVDADFFASRTGNIVHTRSDYGRTYMGKRRVELEGNVAIQSKRGYLFTMPRLNYEGEGHEFTSEDPVAMKGPNVLKPTMLLNGVGLSADIDREHFIIKKNVTSQKKLKGSGWFKSASKGGEFFTDEQRAVFIGNVHSVMPNVTLDSDVLEMVTQDDREVMTARGDVKLKNRGRTGWAESAYLEAGSNQIILTGKAKILSEQNEVNGRKILLYTDEDRIEVLQAEGQVKE